MYPYNKEISFYPHEERKKTYINVKAKYDILQANNGRLRKL